MQQQRKKQKRDADATKAAFVRAGEKVFSERGFAAATLDLLAAEAGANKALISYYFGSKEGLYDAVIEVIVNDVVTRVTSALDDKGDPVRNLKLYIRTLARAIAERPSFSAILMREYIDGSMQEREAPFRQVLKFFGVTQSIYESGRKTKAFRKLDPHKLHLSIVGPIVHFVVAARAREKTLHLVNTDINNPSIEEFAAELETLICNGIRRTVANKRPSALAAN